MMEKQKCPTCGGIVFTYGLPFCDQACFSHKPKDFFNRYETIASVQVRDREAENEKRELFRRIGEW